MNKVYEGPIQTLRIATHLKDMEPGKVLVIEMAKLFNPNSFSVQVWKHNAVSMQKEDGHFIHYHNKRNTGYVTLVCVSAEERIKELEGDSYDKETWTDQIPPEYR